MKQSKPKSYDRRLTELLDADFMARLDGLDVLSRKILQSVEFADHRRYVVGDDLRFVDWNIYGRLEQLFLKLFLEEQDLTVYIVIDSSGSMDFGEPAKGFFIKKLAAALGYVSLVNNNRVSLSSFADGITGDLSHMRGRSYLPQMAEFLLTCRDVGPTFFEKSCRQRASGRFGSGVMIVLSDFLFKDGYQSGLRRLISDRFDLYLIQVLSPQEMEPDLTGELKLVDIEDGDAAEITVSAALLKYYKRTLASYCNELKQFCTQRGAAYVLANSADKVEHLVLNYLRRIGLLR